MYFHIDFIYFFYSGTKSALGRTSYKPHFAAYSNSLMGGKT